MHSAAGNTAAAYECYQRAVDISPDTALAFIKVYEGWLSVSHEKNKSGIDGAHHDHMCRLCKGQRLSILWLLTRQMLRWRTWRSLAALMLY